MEKEKSLPPLAPPPSAPMCRPPRLVFNVRADSARSGQHERGRERCRRADRTGHEEPHGRARGRGFERPPGARHHLLSAMADFAAFNEVYARYFGETPPARSCVQAAAPPRGVMVEVEAIAWR